MATHQMELELEGDDNDADAYQTAGEPSSNPSIMSQEDVQAFLRRRYLESTRRIVPLLHELGFSVRLVRPTGGGDIWQVRERDVDVGADDDAYGRGGFGGVPASSDAMDALPETTVGEGERTEEGCSVCLEGYEAGDTIRTMPCSHGFHKGSILGWLAFSRLCPLCRFALPPAEEESSVVGGRGVGIG